MIRVDAQYDWGRKQKVISDPETWNVVRKPVTLNKCLWCIISIRCSHSNVTWRTVRYRIWPRFVESLYRTAWTVQPEQIPQVTAWAFPLCIYKHVCICKQTSAHWHTERWIWQPSHNLTSHIIIVGIVTMLGCWSEPGRIQNLWRGCRLVCVSISS